MRGIPGRKRRNYNLRLNQEEHAVLQRAAELSGFDGWSAYLRHIGVRSARQVCGEFGLEQGAPDADGPTLWDSRS